MQKISNNERTLSFLNKDSPFSKARSLQQLNPYQMKQVVKKQTNSITHSSGVKRSISMNPGHISNGYRPLETATKVYRVPLNRDKPMHNVEENFAEADNFLEDSEPTLCIGTSVTKPKPPSSITLKYNSTFSGRPRRHHGTVASRATRKGRRKEKEQSNETNEQKKVYETNVLPNKVYNKQDVLSSLRKLSLIEPFLNDKRNSFIPELKNTTFIHLAADNALELPECEQTFSNENHKGFYGKPNNILSNKELSSSKVAVDMGKGPGNGEDVGHDTKGFKPPLSPQHSLSNDMFYVINNNVACGSNKEDYVDTSDNESIVYPVAYNNRISAKDELYPRLRHEMPKSIVSSNNSLSRSGAKRQPQLTQRQLSALPTATVVDISTGSVVANEVETTETDLTVVTENLQQLRNLAGSKTGVPSSFYYNRKIKRQKQDDKTEMLELSKLKEKAKADIRTLLDSAGSNMSQVKPHNVKSEGVKIQEKRPIEFKIVHLPSPKKIEVENVASKSTSTESEQSVSRSASSSTRSSSSASSVKHPCAPNPSPQLTSNRFQIFPTSNPNTFHAYATASSQPTVISVDHFSHARASLNDQNHEKTKLKSSSGSLRKASNGLGFRLSMNSDDGRAKKKDVLNTNTLIKGQSISFKNQMKLEPNSLTDTEIDTTDENNGKTSSEENDEKSIQAPPTHAAQHFFKYSSSGAVKIRKAKENQEQVIYTPLQSLVIKSCQSANPIVVIPESEMGNEERMTNSALPGRTHVPSGGHLSPLKGIRILRRKITVKHSNGEKSPYLEKPGVRYFFNESQRRFVGYEESSKAGAISSETTSLPFYRPSVTAENLNYIREISSKYSNENVPLGTGTAPSLGKEQLAEKSISIDKLCLGNVKATPYLLLKEGSMQSLNFIKPNAVHFSLGPLSNLEARDIMERSAKRRRKIQLGNNGVSDDGVNVKISAGGGFKSNVARYSLLLRQKYHKQQEDVAEKTLEREDILEISKAGIEPANKQGKPMQKLFGESNDDREHSLPVLEGASGNFDGSAKSGPDIVLSESRLQVQDLLDNLYANPSKTPFSPGMNRTKSEESHRQRSIVESRTSLHGINKSPSLDDLYEAGRLRSSTAISPDKGTASFRMSKNLSFNEEQNRIENDALDTGEEGDFLKNGFVGRKVVFSRNEEHNDSRFPNNNSRLDAANAPSRSSFMTHNGDGTMTSYTHASNSNARNAHALSSHYTAAMRMRREGKPSLSYRAEDYEETKRNYQGFNGVPRSSNTADFIALSTSPYKSRNSSKNAMYYNSATSGKDTSFADPCVGASTSFQQRLTELSLLEADTVRFEKSRKLKRKSKPDKES